MTMENILLVTVDSLRADHVGVYGYGRDTTPVVDGLASEGHCFTHAFANAGATRMSFPAILSSTSPLMYGGYRYVSERRTLISEVLDDAGYQTAGFHSNPFLSEQFGYGRGFDTFFDAKSDPSMLSLLRQFAKNRLDNDGLLFRLLSAAFNTTEKKAGVELGSAYVPADDLTDRAIQWLGTVSDDRPWFLWIHYMDVHHPYTPPEKYQRCFRSETIPKRESIRLRRKMLEDPGGITDEELQKLIDLYDAEIRFTDAEVGRLLAHVEPERDETTVLFTADHGEEFREHGQFSHNTLHDEGIHVPLVVTRGGRDETDVMHDDLVALLDLAPTIASIAGCETPESYRGYDASALLDAPSDGRSTEEWPREYVLVEGGSFPDDPFYCYRDHDWKYIDFGGPSLYDLRSDPDEQVDVLDQHPDVLADIERVLEEHERDIESTSETLDSVEIDDDIESRLDALGYR